MKEAAEDGEKVRPISSLTSWLLVHGYHTQAGLEVSREFDFTILPGDIPQEAGLFLKVIRRLKVMSGMNPWPTGATEMGIIDLGLGDKHLRYAITFDNAKGRERASVAAPEHLGSYAAARDAGLLYRRPRAV